MLVRLILFIYFALWGLSTLIEGPGLSWRGLGSVLPAVRPFPARAQGPERRPAGQVRAARRPAALS